MLRLDVDSDAFPGRPDAQLRGPGRQSLRRRDRRRRDIVRSACAIPGGRASTAASTISTSPMSGRANGRRSISACSGANYGWNVYEGPDVFDGGNAERRHADRADPLLRPQRGPVDHRRLRLSRPERGPAGALFLRRLRRREDLHAAFQRQRVGRRPSAPRRSSPMSAPSTARHRSARTDAAISMSSTSAARCSD